MVVSGHASHPNIFYHMIYLVHMPIFFFVAGCTNRNDNYYYSYDNIREFIKKRIHSLYIPYLKYTLPLVLLHNIFVYLDFYNEYFTFKDYVYQIARTLLFSMGEHEPFLKQVWFIKVLFLLEIYYSVFIYIAHKIKINKYYFLIPFTVIPLIINSEIGPHPLRMTFTLPLKCMVYYIIGYEFSKKYNIESYNQSKILSIAFTCIWIITSFYINTSIQHSYGYQSFIQFLISLMVIPTILILGHYIQSQKHIKHIVATIGTNTFPIYFLHIYAFKITSIIMIYIASNMPSSNFNWTKNYAWCIHPIGGIVLPMIFLYIIQKIKELSAKIWV